MWLRLKTESQNFVDPGPGVSKCLVLVESRFEKYRPRLKINYSNLKLILNLLIFQSYSDPKGLLNLG